MSGPTSLPQLFNELHRCCQNSEYQKVVQVANRILQDSPQDKDAFRCKVLAMIHQSNFNDALTMINKNNVLSKGMDFEKAYSEYRLNRLDESLRTIDSVSSEVPAPEQDFRMKELKAQIFYRLERYEDSLRLYKELLKESGDDYEEERLTNVAAVAAALQLQGESSQAKTVDSVVESVEPTYEIAFNKVFALIARKKFKEAETQLRKVEDICRRSFEDDPEALEEELVVIRVQLAFVLQMQGRSNEANNLYNAVLKQRTADPAVLAVASNNIVTLNRDQNIFDSKKKIKTATMSNLSHKLMSSQQAAIALNQALILMYSGQGDACRKMVHDLLRKGSDMEEELHLVLAASLLREKNTVEAITMLREYISKASTERWSDCRRSALALVQLYLQQGSISQAVEALKGMGGGDRFRPGVVATVVALLKNMEDKDAAVEYLLAAIADNKKKSNSSAVVEQLMRECASAMLALGQNARAVTLLEEIRTKAPKDLRLLAQLITAYATLDPVQAQRVSLDLPSPEEMAAGVNVAELEARCYAAGPKYSKKVQVKDADKSGKESSPVVKPSATELLQGKSKKRRKRRGKLPKNYDPKVDPDPERWLARKDRSAYKGRRRDKRKDGVGKGTQGGVGNVEGLDASKPASGAIPKAASPPTGSPVTTPSGPAKAASQPQKPSGGANKSKKPQGKKKKKGGW